MFDYPPSHFRLFDLLILVGIPLAILVAVAAILWRPKRQLAAFDAFWWSVAWVGVLVIQQVYGGNYLGAPAAGDRAAFGSLALGMLCLFFAAELVTLVRVGMRQRTIPQAIGAILATAGSGLAPIIIAVIITPANSGHFKWQEQTSCKYKLREIVLKLHDEHDVAKVFPATAGGDPPISWRVLLLPRLDQQRLFARYDKSFAWNAAPNDALISMAPSEYQCPTDVRWRKHDGDDSRSFTSYAAAVGDDAALSVNGQRTFSDLHDGTSNTALLLEVCGLNIPWSEPRDVDISKVPLGVNLPGNQRGMSQGVLSSQHWSNCAQVAFADGAVRTIRENIDPETLRRILHRNDGLPVGDF